MKLKTGEWFLLIFNAFYVIVFMAYYLSVKNYEFLWYVAVLIFFLVLIGVTLKRSQFDYIILWGLSLWGIMHMAGGGIIVHNDVLYALRLFPFYETENIFVLKYDQLVHFFGFGVTALVIYHLLKPYLSEYTNWKIVYPLIVVAASGAGALNEIVEFIAVLTIPDTGVGGYENTALDLVFNTLGATIALFIIHARRKRREKHA